jgi:hypothetical protein
MASNIIKFLKTQTSKRFTSLYLWLIQHHVTRNKKESIDLITIAL